VRSKSGMGTTEWWLLFVLSVLWGASFFYYKVLDQTLPALTLVFFRVTIAAIALLFVVRLRGVEMPRDAGTWSSLAVMGFLNCVLPFSLIAWSETQISSGLASVLNASTPLFTVVLAHFAGKDRITPSRTFGVIFGFSGVVLLVGTSVLGGLHLTSLGQGAGVLAAILYACAGIFGRRFKQMSPLVVATGQLVTASLISAPFAFAIDRPWTLAAPQAGDLGAMLGLSVLSTAAGYLIYFRILSSAGPTNVLLVTLLMPITALLLGAAFLHESVTRASVFGMALISIGLLTIDGRVIQFVRGQAYRGQHVAARE
jgi:drug/metabolite transporter (DMT)-like permease